MIVAALGLLAMGVRRPARAVVPAEVEPEPEAEVAIDAEAA